jgi:hypothetical protein
MGARLGREGRWRWVGSSAAFSIWVVAASLAGCERANPAYHPGDAAAPSDAAIEAAPPDGSTDGTSDANPLLTCATAADCTAQNGAPPCGVWECQTNQCAAVCPACTDGDHDGFGVGAGCAGPDCDDTDPNIGSAGQRACYSGDVGTAGVGACHAGGETCTAGVWSGRCIGQVVPTGEACNGEDDDCNGTVDDGLGTFSCGVGSCLTTVPACTGGVIAACVPTTASVALDGCDGVDNDCDGLIDEDCVTTMLACVHVSPDGSDSAADGSIALPFRTIQPAIARAAAAAGGASKNVCVAGGRSCSDSTTYQLADGATMVMANGVSVFGNYESTTWTRCPLDPALPRPSATIELHVGPGIQFPAAVTTPTTLDGFHLMRAPNLTPSIGVTVNAAKQVTLSNLVIDDAPAVNRSYGVNLVNGAEALITHCAILGGAASVETIGVRSIASKPTIRENCATLDPSTGRCLVDCGSVIPVTGPAIGIRGRIAAATTGASTAVLLQDSTGASVETSALCGTQGQQGAALHITGASANVVVRGNIISAAGGAVDSHAVWAEECNDAAPWIVDNQRIEAQGAGFAVGMRSVGACHPVIDGNVAISGGGEGTSSTTAGVSCEMNTGTGVSSQCAVLGNRFIQGSSSNHPLSAAGVICDDGACGRVAGNSVAGNLGNDVIGIWLRATGVTVDRNRITGGCGQRSSVGVETADAFARIQNNLIGAGNCLTSGGTPSLGSAGLHAYNVDGVNELDVDSNTIDGGGSNGGAGNCTSTGVDDDLGAGTPPSAPKGIFRNNIIRAGACDVRVDFAETDTTVDPRVFENNDLDPTGAPSGLYLDENATRLTTVTAVNGLADVAARANLSVDPMFVSDPSDLHLTAGSACVNAGTAVGAPVTDLDGKRRNPNTPSIGAYEP